MKFVQRYDSCELCEDLGETCRHCKTPRRNPMKILKELWHGLLVHFGLRPCCDNPNIKANRDSVYYYEYECKNCGNIKTGGAHDRLL